MHKNDKLQKFAQLLNKNFKKYFIFVEKKWTCLLELYLQIIENCVKPGFSSFNKICSALKSIAPMDVTALSGLKKTVWFCKKQQYVQSFTLIKMTM